jgi:hypothetical protein
MKFIAALIGLMFFALVVLVPASAAVVEQKVGPYIVTFDLSNSSLELNSSASYWDDSTPGYAQGVIYIVQKSHPSFEVADITISHGDSGMSSSLNEPNSPNAYAESLASDALVNSLREQGYTNVTHYNRVIDNDMKGSLVVAEGKYTEYVATYRFDKYTTVNILSKMSMSGGTGDLLNTIHIAK